MVGAAGATAAGVAATAGGGEGVGIVGVGLAASSGPTVGGAAGAGAPGAGAELATVLIGPAVPDEEPDENTAAVTSAQTAAQHTTAQRFSSSLFCRLRSDADCGPPRGTDMKRRNGARLAPRPLVSWDDPPVWRGSPVPLAMATLDSLAAEYDGAGLHHLPDPKVLASVAGDLADAAALKREWDPPEPHCLNLALQQACCLANQRVEPARG